MHRRTSLSAATDITCSLPPAATLAASTATTSPSGSAAPAGSPAPAAPAGSAAPAAPAAPAAATIGWLLRVGVAFCFIGHGVFGLLRKEEWLVYFDLFGIGAGAAWQLMPLVGGIDILVGIAALVWPARAIVIYAAAWCVWTAALRPLAGQGVWELLERAGNYGVPLALLALASLQPGTRGWLRPQRIHDAPAAARLLVFRICQATTALLLVGHGALALGGKPLLAGHVAAIGLDPAIVLPLAGAFEIALAALCIARPGAALFVLIVVWKLGTEALFPISGAPIWEFIERGGSYVAPVVAALTVAALPARSRRAVPAAAPAGRTHAGAPAAAPALAIVSLVAAALLGTPGSAAAQARTTTLSPELLAQLRAGGYVLACRHGITDHEVRPDRPHSFDDPTTQRTLTADGEAQMNRVGAALRALGLVFDDVRASPYHRNMRSAELMFGKAVVDEALFGEDRPAERAALFAPVLRPGENRALVTHQAVLRSVMRTRTPIEEGDCLVVRGDRGRPVLVAHLAAEAWATRR